MARRLTRVIRRVKRSTPKKTVRKKKRGGYDMSYRDSGYRPVSKTEQNERHR